jgi:tetratricopeptide (TPR) repeat protein
MGTGSRCQVRMGSPEAQSPPRFVGREEELALLNGRLEAALAGRGSVIFMSAEPGAGKTTLTSRFLDQVSADHPDAFVIRAGCSEQYGAGEPYQPFVEAFRHLLREREGRQERSFRDLAKQLAPVWLAAIPVAGEIMAASLTTASELQQQFRTGGGPAAASEEALFFQYSELFFAAAAAAPLILFLDDLHWADRASVSLLTHLGRRVGDQRILILGTYRPTEVDADRHPMRDARQELMRYRVAEEMSLAPLATEALSDLILLQTGAAPSVQLLDWLVRRAGTNALFFEELLNWLVSQGFTRDNLGELQLVRVPQEIEIPRSAESTIEKRLDRLDEETRRLLEYASVQGDDFDSVSLAQLLDRDELELEESLEPIARTHRLIQLIDTRDLPNGDIASVYRFSHSLVQDVLHRGLQGKRRILLHRKMAQILEQIYSGDAAFVAPRLAVHFEEGRQKEKAYEYALLAADRASRLYAHWDALEQIQRALRNAAEAAQHAVALERLAEEYVSTGNLADGVQALADALGHVDAAADVGSSLRLRRKRILLETTQGTIPLPRMLSAMTDLRTEAQQALEVAEECQIIWQMIDLPGTAEQLDVTLAREALRLAEQSGDPWLIARGHHVLGAAIMFVDPASAMGDLRRAVQLYGELGDRSRQAASTSYLALAHVFLGEFGSAVSELESAVATFQEIMDPVRASVARTNLGTVLRNLGEYESAEKMLLESVRTMERLGAPVRLLSPLMSLAELAEAQGDWAMAERRWTEMLERAEETGYTSEQIIAHCGIGTARLRQGDRRASPSEHAARELMQTDPENMGESGEAFQLYTARVAAATGEIEGAAVIFERLENAARGRDRFMGNLYRLERAEILKDVNPDKALELAETARNEFDSMAARPSVERADNLIAELRGSYAS